MDAREPVCFYLSLNLSDHRSFPNSRLTAIVVPDLPRESRADQLSKQNGQVPKEFHNLKNQMLAQPNRRL